MKRLSLFLGIAASAFAVGTPSMVQAAALSPAPIGSAVTKSASVVQQVHFRRHGHHRRYYRPYYGYGYGYGYVPFISIGHGHHGFGHGGFGHGGHHGHH